MAMATNDLSRNGSCFKNKSLEYSLIMSPGHVRKEADVTGFKFSAWYLPVIFARMLLDQLKAVFLGEKHEAVHGSLGLVRVLARLLGRRHRRRHHRARGCGGPH